MLGSGKALSEDDIGKSGSGEGEIGLTGDKVGQQLGIKPAAGNWGQRSLLPFVGGKGHNPLCDFFLTEPCCPLKS